jgi:prepilin peptidase CpaA
VSVSGQFLCGLHQKLPLFSSERDRDVSTTLCQIALGIILLIAVVTDIRSHRIYNWLTFPAIALGLLLNSLGTGLPGLFFALGGIGVASLSIVLFLLGAMGAGDVKLLGAVGALMGPHFTLWALLCTAILGGVLGVVYAVRKGALRHTIQNAIVGGHLCATLHAPEELRGMALTSKVGKMPYAPAIALGVLSVVLLKSLGVV